MSRDEAWTGRFFQACRVLPPLNGIGAPELRRHEAPIHLTQNTCRKQEPYRGPKLRTIWKQVHCNRYSIDFCRDGETKVGFLPKGLSSIHFYYFLSFL